MSFTEEDVRHVAKLSCLKVSDEEVKTLRSDMEQILEFVNKLSEADTKGVPPTSHVHGVVNAFREDVIREPLAVETALANAPDATSGGFRVPRII